MKNIFIVVNKEKIYAYVVSVITIFTLLFMSTMINSKFDDSEMTSSINYNENYSYNENNIKNNILEQ